MLSTRAPSAYEVLHREPLGSVYFDDPEHSAHTRYGVDVAIGAVVVIRPDGWVGTMTGLESGAVQELEGYFGDVLMP